MNVFGVDIGGTKTAVSRLTDDKRVEEVARFPTSGPGETVSRILRELDALGPKEGPLIGISCGGPLDSRRGLILSPPNLKGWDRVPICDLLKDRFGGQAFIMNDANACALAEWRFGAGVGCKNMVFLTSGTGMGAGLILDGRLYEGTTGDAGEVGHMRLADAGPAGFGKEGSFEGFCSGGGIARLARLRLPPEGARPAWARADAEIDAKAVAAAAGAGDGFALEIMRESGLRLGQALALIIDILNPERIVIGGFYPKSRHLLEPSMRSAIDREALASARAACEVLPATLGDSIGCYGAICAALEGANVHLEPRIVQSA